LKPRPTERDTTNRAKVSLNTPKSNLAGARKMIREMVAEALELKSAAGGSVADAMAAWLAPQYLLAVRAQLAALPDGPERLKILKGNCAFYEPSSKKASFEISQSRLASGV
jgi:hypothetical protein